ncbi:MAG: S1 RNA-binding domain-containing protein, partial [candidate division NC10 bacterium]|nr:S1 RNA-binding domain-containing protein [candidate division NC10 bacterium]
MRMPKGSLPPTDPDYDPRSADLTAEMQAIYDQTFKDIAEGEIVRGRVVEVTTDAVLIDIGYKSEGTVPLKEFTTPQGEVAVQVGTVVDVYLESKEDSEGLIVLSREKAEKIKIWEQISRVYEQGGAVQGTIVGKTKGGLMVDIGVRAFLPGSQVDLRPARDLDRLIGKTFPMKIIKLNQKRGNIVLSRRELLEEERKALKTQTLATLEEGKVFRGKIKNITE